MHSGDNDDAEHSPVRPLNPGAIVTHTVSVPLIITLVTKITHSPLSWWSAIYFSEGDVQLSDHAQNVFTWQMIPSEWTTSIQT